MIIVQIYEDSTMYNSVFVSQGNASTTHTGSAGDSSYSNHAVDSVYQQQKLDVVKHRYPVR